MVSATNERTRDGIKNALAWAKREAALNLKDLVRRPRVEILPALLNLPLAGVVLYLVLANDEYWDEINSIGGLIFGTSGDLDFVSIMLVLSIVVGAISIAYVAFTLASVKFGHCIAFHIIPSVFLGIVSILFMVVFTMNDWLTFSSLYNMLGREIGRIVYVIVAILFMMLGTLLIIGLPILWHLDIAGKGTTDREGVTGRTRPKIMAGLTLAGCLAGMPFYLQLLFGHPAHLLWESVTFGYYWDPMLVLVHAGAAIMVPLVLIINATRNAPKKGKIGGKQHLVIVFWGIFFGLQCLSLLLLGMVNGYDVTAFNLLSFVTLGEAIVSGFTILEQRLAVNFHQNGKKKPLFVRPVLLLLLFLPFSWLVFLQPFVQTPPRPRLPTFHPDPVKNDYAGLTSTQKLLFDEYMNQTYPVGTQPANVLTGSQSTRTMARLASGLLFRNGTGDVADAVEIIEWLLGLQNTNEVDAMYGSWMTSINNDNHDQNWREFVGCELLLILERHEAKLNATLVSKIEHALLMAAEGAMRRDVGPGYTNIAVMSALLMERAGHDNGRRDIEAAGLEKAWQVFLMFNRNHSFSEYNSPTYDGVTMAALAMWRELGASEEIRTIGALMERDAWHEIANRYHAGLRTMVGPFFRSYGMDMNAYNSIIGIWIALALDDASVAPLPRKTHPMYFELSNIFNAVQLGHAVPAVVKDALSSFSGPRHLVRHVPQDNSLLSFTYTVTMTLKEHWMMGGVSGKGREWGQFKPGTIYWNVSSTGDLAWMLVPGNGFHSVSVDDTTMTIGRLDGGTGITMYFNAKNIDPANFTTSTWMLPGMTLSVDASPSAISAAAVNAGWFKTAFSIAEGVDTIIQVNCTVPVLHVVPQIA